MRRAQIDGQQFLSGLQLSRRGQFLGFQRHGHGVLHDQMGRCQQAFHALCGQKISTETAAVTNHSFGTVIVSEFFRQLSQTNRTIFGKTG